MPKRRLVILLSQLVLSVLVLAFILGPARPMATAAESPCLYTEDGRCIPAAVPVEKAPSVQKRAQRQPAAKGPGILVKRKAEVPAQAFGKRLQAAGFAGAKGLLVPRWWRIPVPKGQATAALIQRLKAMPEVEVVEEDGQVKASFIPNDPSYTEQWGLPKVQAPAAWDLTLGSSDVLIAVVDTGIDMYHPDIPTNLLLGHDFVDGDDDPYDDINGHGTLVAGIAAARTNNDTGVAGLCPNCAILAVRVLDSWGDGNVSDVADGIKYAADQGVQKTIINLGLGTPDYSQLLADAVSYAQGTGALVVAAAGNAGPGPADYPAALPNVLAVSATDSNDAPASWPPDGASQYGRIAAPGSNILSLYPGGDYAYADGTSLSSAFVAGAAGLVWSKVPTYTTYTATDVASRLLKYVNVPSGWNANFGTGRLNAHRPLLFPPAPYHATGTVTLNDAPAPAGTQVIAVAGNVNAGQITTTVDGYFDMLVSADDPGTEPKDGGVAGDKLTFMIGDYPTCANGVWSSGGAGEFNLVAQTQPDFADVPLSDWGFCAIRQIYNAGITTGCSQQPLLYCPDTLMDRRQTAVFIVRAMGLTQCTTCTQHFADVPPSDWAYGWIERFYEQGLTSGCNGGQQPLLYCPDSLVSRREMAAFIVRAMGLTQCTDCQQHFADVPPSDWAFGWIERFYEQGITTGCSQQPLLYCPDNQVTRRDMAAFLVRAFPDIATP